MKNYLKYFLLALEAYCLIKWISAIVNGHWLYSNRAKPV